MGIYSGRDAYVDGISCVQSWQVQVADAIQRYAASCVPGGTNAPAGVLDWTGQIAGVGAQPPIFPTGEPISFQGVIRNSSPLRSLTGSILIEQLTIDINAEDGSPIRWTATFGAIGALAEAASGAVDSVIAEAPPGTNLAIEIDGNPVTSALRTAQLVFRRPSATYVDGGVTARVGGNLEADLNFSVYEDSLEVAAFAPNSLSPVDVYVTPTTFWSFKNIRFAGKSNFTVDRVSHAVLGYQVNGLWNAAQDDDLGHIIGPDETVYFGDEGSS